MELKKEGFTIKYDGEWFEISNVYGILRCGIVERMEGDTDESVAQRCLNEYISGHVVADQHETSFFKRVARDRKTGEYCQIQVKLLEELGTWAIQKYDSELRLMTELLVEAYDGYDVIKKTREKYDIQKCLKADVFRSRFGDCTNDGISSKRDCLYILGSDGPFEPSDIRECVVISSAIAMGKEYLTARPAYAPKRWYMAGGNFLYTSDIRFREYTGLSYPIPIHDRCEEV